MPLLTGWSLWVISKRPLFRVGFFSSRSPSHYISLFVKFPHIKVRYNDNNNNNSNNNNNNNNMIHQKYPWQNLPLVFPVLSKLGDPFISSILPLREPEVLLRLDGYLGAECGDALGNLRHLEARELGFRG